jgi:HlyD family secretion protein
LPAAPAHLRPDMTVSVNVEVGRRADALVVPAESIRDAATAPWVLRVVDGRAERRPVRVGLRGEGMIEVVDGLAPGDAVVLPAAGAVEVGARVRARRVDREPDPLPSPASRGDGSAGTSRAL